MESNLKKCPPRCSCDEIARDVFSRPTRAFIATFRTFLRITILAVGCTLPAISSLLAAELFPFAPPSPSQQRSIEQSAQVRPHLSAEDHDKIAKVAAQAKKLSPDDQKKFRASIQKSLNETASQGNLNQVKYLTELLQQME